MAQEQGASLFLLRDRLDRHRKIRGQRQGLRWPREIQAAVVQLYEQGDLSLQALGRELGLPPQTVGNWIRQAQSNPEAKPRAGFRELRVKTSKVDPRDGLLLQTPRGFGLSGLSFYQVLELFSRALL